MRTSWLGVGGGALCVALVACGAADEMAGRMLEDAGELLADAGRAMVDAGTGASGHADAQAAPMQSMTLTCDKETVTTALTKVKATGAVQMRQVTKARYAELDGSGVTGVDAWTCDPVAAPVAPVDPAATHVTEVTTTGNVPPVECVGALASLGGGKVRVSCGMEITTTSYDSGMPAKVLSEHTYAATYRSVRLIVRR